MAFWPADVPADSKDPALQSAKAGVAALKPTKRVKIITIREIEAHPCIRNSNKKHVKKPIKSIKTPKVNFFNQLLTFVSQYKLNFRIL